jgi:hypothetical protein
MERKMRNQRIIHQRIMKVGSGPLYNPNLFKSPYFTEPI